MEAAEPPEKLRTTVSSACVPVAKMLAPAMKTQIQLVGRNMFASMCPNRLSRQID
ncbi:hypothetical protein [Bradyrhizobium liaoningense]|jgi:hypothetical protein